MRREILILGKILINTGILFMLPLPLPLFYENEAFTMQILLFALPITFIGCFLCIIANVKAEKNISSKPIWHPLITLYFKAIKWSMIIAVGFHIIAACIIFYFYWLKHELEATLLITVVVGIVIGLICEVAIPYYKNYKEPSEHNCSCRQGPYSHPEYGRPRPYTISVGMFSQNPVLEIYIKTLDGCIPRFYIRDHEKNGASGSKFHTCIRFQSNTYFNHMGAEDILSTEQKTELIKYLERGVGAYKNWHRLIDVWNGGNHDTMLPYNLEMPDYSTL